MMKVAAITLLALFSMPLVSSADNETVNGLIEQYVSQGANTPDAQQGQQMWNRAFPGEGEQASRSCASCHTRDLTASGKHIRTGKAIKPMAPAVNPERLSSSREVEKWFLRNCKWTLGRECTPQEKADFLAYISNPIRF